MANEKENNNCDGDCNKCNKEKIYNPHGYTCYPKGLFNKIYNESKDEDDDI